MGLPWNRRLVHWTKSRALQVLKMFNPSTMKEIDTDTLELLPNTTPIPVFTDAEAIDQSITDIVNILKKQARTTSLRYL